MTEDLTGRKLRSAGRPTVFVHVGEPKSGTTFLQNALWSNRATLAAQGLRLPGLHEQEHFRANMDLRGVPQAPDDPAGSYAGEWNLLAAEAVRSPGRALISHEQLAGATGPQAARALETLAAAEVHVVITVRDFASILPAEWQETVKHASVLGWQRWVRRLMANEPGSADAQPLWFWAVHDTVDVLRRWSAGVPPERVHVVVTPRRGSAPTLLWERFASVLGVSADSVDLSGARPNASLGMAETELLRRLNIALRRGEGVPDWFYTEHVKERLAHQVLAGRPVNDRPVLNPRQQRWAVERSEKVIAELQGAGYDIVGDLDELRPRLEPPAAGRKRPRRRVAPSAVLDAAVAALAAEVREQYARQATTPEPARSRVKRWIRDRSARSTAVRRARVVVWRAVEAFRSRRAS